MVSIYVSYTKLNLCFRFMYFRTKFDLGFFPSTVVRVFISLQNIEFYRLVFVFRICISGVRTSL